MGNPDVDLLKENVGNVPVWVKLHGVPVIAFWEDGLSAIAMKLELKGNIMVVMPKIIREGYYTCSVHVENEWKTPRCWCCKVFGHTQEECPKNIRLGVAKNLKKHSQTSRGTNGETTNLVNIEANSSGSSFMNVKNSSTSNTLIIDKIKKFEDLLIDGQAILVDEADNPLKKAECLGDCDSEDEVASVDYDMARSLASERVGFETQTLLEQWMDYYGNGDYDEDPYDDDMYEGQDLS
nr:hypothetical protein [Tanacetum cinerariifolium]